MINIKELKIHLRKFKSDNEIEEFFNHNNLTFDDYILDANGYRKFHMGYLILKSGNKLLIKKLLDKSINLNTPYYIYNTSALIFEVESSFIRALSEKNNLSLLKTLLAIKHVALLEEKHAVFDLYIQRKNEDALKILFEQIKFTKEELLKVPENSSYNKVIKLNHRLMFLLSLNHASLKLIEKNIAGINFYTDPEYIESSLKAFNGVVFEKLLDNYGYFEWQFLFKERYSKKQYNTYGRKEITSPLMLLIREGHFAIPKIKYILDNYKHELMPDDLNILENFIYIYKDIDNSMVSYLYEKGVPFQLKNLYRFTLNENKKDKAETFITLLDILSEPLKTINKETTIKIMKGIVRNYDIEQFNEFIKRISLDKNKETNLLDIFIICCLAVKITNMKNTNKEKFMHFFYQAYELLENKGLTLNIEVAKKKEDAFISAFQQMIFKKKICNVENSQAAGKRERL